MTHNQVVTSKLLSIALIVFTVMIFSSAGKYPQNITANQLSQIDAANDDELYMGFKLKYKDSISCKTGIHDRFTLEQCENEIFYEDENFAIDCLLNHIIYIWFGQQGQYYSNIIFVGNGEYNCNLYPYEIYLDKGILQIYKHKKLILTKFFLPK